MTTQAATIGGIGTRPRAGLEALVDRLMAALFRAEPETAMQTRDNNGRRRAWPGASTRRGGCGRRETSTGRWRSSPAWTRRGRRRRRRRGGPTPSGRTWCGGGSATGSGLVYSQGTGQAAALVPTGDGALEVAAVLGMRWEPGKLVSRRSLRGLKPLGKGGASWS